MTIAPASAPSRGMLARASGLVAFSACCFGSIPIFVSLGTAAGATLLTLLAWRYALGAVLLLGVGGGPRALRIPRAQWMPMLLVGGAGQALVAGTSLSALRYIPAATLSFLFYTYPAWVAIIAAIRGTERLTVRRVVALSLSFGGIVLMVGSPWSAPMHPLGVALALGSALLYALYVPAVGRVQRGIAPPVSGALISIGALVLLLVLALATGTFSIRLAPVAWMSVIGLGLVSTMIGFIAFLRGLAVLGPVRTAIISTVEPFWTASMGAIVLSQPFTKTTLAGGAMIAAAVTVLQTAKVEARDPRDVSRAMDQPATAAPPPDE